MQEDKIERRGRRMIELFDKAPIKTAFGMELSYQDRGAVFRMPYNPSLDHFLGGIHGGVISTLLDNAGWFTAALYYDFWVATVELTVRLLEAVSETELVSKGRLVKAGKRLAVCEMEVRADSGLLVAVGSGTFAVTSAPLEDRITGRQASAINK